MCRVGFLEKKQGLAASCGLDSEKVDPYPVFLSLLDSDSDIFISRKENAIHHRPVPGQCEHVRNDQGIDTFLLSSRIHEPETNFHICLISKRDVLWGWTLRGAVIPVDSEQRPPRFPLSKALQCRNRGLVVEIDISTRQLGAAQLLRSLCEEVAGVNKDRHSVHRYVPVSDTRFLVILAGYHLVFDAVPESIHSSKIKRVPAGTLRVGRSIYRIVGTVGKMWR